MQTSYNTPVASASLVSSCVTPACKTSRSPRLLEGRGRLIDILSVFVGLPHTWIAVRLCHYYGARYLCHPFIASPLTPMRCSISRPVENASADVEWPGPDSRRWRQTTLFKSSSGIGLVDNKPVAFIHPPRSKSESDTSDSGEIGAAPLSPSLRNTSHVLPPVEPGQQRIPLVARVSHR